MNEFLWHLVNRVLGSPAVKYCNFKPINESNVPRSSNIIGQALTPACNTEPRYDWLTLRSLTRCDKFSAMVCNSDQSMQMDKVPDPPENRVSRTREPVSDGLDLTPSCRPAHVHSWNIFKNIYLTDWLCYCLKHKTIFYIKNETATRAVFHWDLLKKWGSRM